MRIYEDNDALEGMIIMDVYAMMMRKTRRDLSVMGGIFGTVICFQKPLHLSERDTERVWNRCDVCLIFATVFSRQNKN